MESLECLSILGVRIRNATREEAIDHLESLIKHSSTSHDIFIVNAHTLNLASEDEQYRRVLNDASVVYADGTGVRWASRLRGVELKDNLVGTDLIPELFQATAGKGYKYYLLGADADTIERAAKTCKSRFPGWVLAGYHHGYLSKDASIEVVDQINRRQPQMLLVGMGNPHQEKWISENKNRLSVPVCVGVGGLFDHWGNNLARAPRWVRRAGFEWFQLLIQQPHKWRRYLLGNPKFLFRMAATRHRDRARSRQ